MRSFERLISHPSLATLRSRTAIYARHFQLDRAIRAARDASAGPIPDAIVTEICACWGDATLAAADGALRAMLIEAQKSHGYILQCGSDLTTLLLAIQIERRGVRLWSFESNPHAANVLRSWLSQYDLGHANVIATATDLTGAGVGYNFDPAR